MHAVLSCGIVVLCSVCDKPFHFVFLILFAVFQQTVPDFATQSVSLCCFQNEANAQALAQEAERIPQLTTKFFPLIMACVSAFSHLLVCRMRRMRRLWLRRLNASYRCSPAHPRISSHDRRCAGGGGGGGGGAAYQAIRLSGMAQHAHMGRRVQLSPLH